MKGTKPLPTAKWQFKLRIVLGMVGSSGCLHSRAFQIAYHQRRGGELSLRPSLPSMILTKQNVSTRSRQSLNQQGVPNRDKLRSEFLKVTKGNILLKLPPQNVHALLTQEEEKVGCNKNPAATNTDNQFYRPRHYGTLRGDNPLACASLPPADREGGQRQKRV